VDVVNRRESVQLTALGFVSARFLLTLFLSVKPVVHV
jgi:hypothetical protein